MGSLFDKIQQNRRAGNQTQSANNSPSPKPQTTASSNSAGNTAGKANSGTEPPVKPVAPLNPYDLSNPVAPVSGNTLYDAIMRNRQISTFNKSVDTYNRQVSDYNKWLEQQPEVKSQEPYQIKNFWEGAGYTGKRYLAGALEGAENIANDWSNRAVMASPDQVWQQAYTEFDYLPEEERMRPYTAWLATQTSDQIDALEFTGTMPDPRVMYADMKRDEAQKQLDADLESQVRQLSNYGITWGTDFTNKYITERYGNNVTGVWGFIGNTAGTMGNMLPAQLARLIPVVGPAVSTAMFFSSAAGAATKQALEEGATAKQAMNYGDAIGVIEAATEKMFDGLAGTLGKGNADTLVEELVNALPVSRGLRNLTRWGISMFGEGTEEVVSDLLDPLASALTLDKKHELDWAQIGMDFLYGVATGSIMSSANFVNGNYQALNQALESKVMQKAFDEFNQTKSGKGLRNWVTAHKNLGDAISHVDDLVQQKNKVLQVARKKGVSQDDILNAGTPVEQILLAKQLGVDPDTFGEIRQFILDMEDGAPDEVQPHISVNGDIAPEDMSTPPGMEAQSTPAEAQAPAAENMMPEAPAAVEAPAPEAPAPQAVTQPSETPAQAPAQAPVQVQAPAVENKVAKAGNLPKATKKKAAPAAVQAEAAKPAEAPAPAIISAPVVAEETTQEKAEPTPGFKPAALVAFKKAGRDLITKAHSNISALSDNELTTVISLLKNAGAGRFKIDAGLQAIYDAAVNEKNSRAEAAAKIEADKKAKIEEAKAAQEQKSKELEERIKAAAEEERKRKEESAKGRVRIKPKAEIKAEEEAAKRAAAVERLRARRAAESGKKAAEEPESAKPFVMTTEEDIGLPDKVAVSDEKAPEITLDNDPLGIRTVHRGENGADHRKIPMTDELGMPVRDENGNQRYRILPNYTYNLDKMKKRREAVEELAKKNGEDVVGFSMPVELSSDVKQSEAVEYLLNALARMNDFFTGEEGLGKFYDLYNLLLNTKPIRRRAKATVRYDIINAEMQFRQAAAEMATEYDSLTAEEKKALRDRWLQEYGSEFEKYGLSETMVNLIAAGDMDLDQWKAETEKRKAYQPPARTRDDVLTKEDNLADAKKAIPDLRSFFVEEKRDTFVPAKEGFAETPSLKGLRTESKELHRVLANMSLEQLREAYKADQPKSPKAKKPERLKDIQWWIDYRQMQQDRLDKRRRNNPRYTRSTPAGEVMLTEDVKNMTDEELADALYLAERTLNTNAVPWKYLSDDDRNLLSARLDEAAAENKYRRMEQNEATAEKQNFKGESRDELRDEDTRVLTRDSSYKGSSLKKNSSYSPKALAFIENHEKYNPDSNGSFAGLIREKAANIAWLMSHPQEAGFSYNASGDAAEEFEDAVVASSTTASGDDAYQAVENMLLDETDNTIYSLIDGIIDGTLSEEVDGFTEEARDAIIDYAAEHGIFEALRKASDLSNEETTANRAIPVLLRASSMKEFRQELAKAHPNVRFKIEQAFKEGRVPVSENIKRLGGLDAVKKAVTEVNQLNAGSTSAFYKSRKGQRDESARITVDENGDLVIPRSHTSNGRANITDVPVSYKLIDNKGNIRDVSGFVLQAKQTAGRPVGIREIKTRQGTKNFLTSWAVDDLETGHTLGTFPTKDAALTRAKGLVQTYAAAYNNSAETRADYQGAAMAILESYKAENGGTTYAQRDTLHDNDRNLGREKRNDLWDLIRNPQSAGMARETQSNVPGGAGENLGGKEQKNAGISGQVPQGGVRRLTPDELRRMSNTDKFNAFMGKKTVSRDYELSTGAKVVGNDQNFLLNYAEDNGKKLWYVYNDAKGERTYIGNGGTLLSEEDMNKAENADVKEALEVLAGVGRTLSVASDLFEDRSGRAGGFVYPENFKSIFAAITNRFKGSVKHESGHSLLDDLESKTNRATRRRVLKDFGQEVMAFGKSVGDDRYLQYTIDMVGRTYGFDTETVDGYYRALEELFVDTNAQGSAWGIIDGRLLQFINSQQESVFDRLVQDTLGRDYPKEAVDRYINWFKSANNEQVAGEGELVAGRALGSANYQLMPQTESEPAKKPIFGEFDPENKEAFQTAVDAAEKIGTMDFALGYGADFYDNGGKTKYVTGPDGKKTEVAVELKDDDAYKRAEHAAGEFQKKFVDVVYGRLDAAEFAQWYINLKGKEGFGFYDDSVANAWKEVLDLADKAKTETRYGKKGDETWSSAARLRRAALNAINITATKTERKVNSIKMMSEVEASARANGFKDPKGGLLKLGARAYTALQLNPDTFWKIVGGFKGKGVTYKLANAIKHNTATENEVFAEAHSRFSEMQKKKGFFEFAAEKDSPIDVAGTKLSQMKVVNLIKLLDTLSETNTKGGSRIFNVNNFVLRDRKGNITTKISLQDIVGKPLETADDAKAAREKLYNQLSPVAKEYMSAAEDVFEMLKGRVDATYYGINGVRLPTYAKGKYTPVHYASEGGASTRDAAAYDLGIHRREKGDTVRIKPVIDPRSEI